MTRRGKCRQSAFSTLNKLRRMLIASVWLMAWSPGARSASMCPPRCTCLDAEFRTECLNAQLDMVPWTLNPRLQTLSLRGNQIKQVSSSFASYSTLRDLDVSRNQLVSLEGSPFQALVELTALDLSRNMIAGVNNETFSGLVQLVRLDLSSNYIQQVPAGTFRDMAQLKRLDLSHNRISNISDERVFQGSKRLRYLSLRKNALAEIPTLVFKHLVELVVLDLGLNDISFIPVEAFLPLRTLEELHVDGCKIQAVQPGAFRALGSLRVLRLQDNKLNDTPSASFSDIPRLEELYIGQNPFRCIRDRALQHLRHLLVLELSGATELQTFEANALIDNQQLERVTISYNVRLSRLESATFRPLANLREVNLRANGLASLPVDLLPVAWEKLDKLDIRDNPLVCNCTLQWLFKLRDHHLQGLPSNREEEGPALDSEAVAAPEAGEQSETFAGVHPQTYQMLPPLASETTKVKCVAPPSLAGVYLDDVGGEATDPLGCNRWTSMLRLVATAFVLGILLLLTVLLVCYICYVQCSRCKGLTTPCRGRRKLSPKAAVVIGSSCKLDKTTPETSPRWLSVGSHKQSAATAANSGSVTGSGEHKFQADEHVYSQTRLPSMGSGVGLPLPPSSPPPPPPLTQLARRTDKLHDRSLQMAGNGELPQAGLTPRIAAAATPSRDYHHHYHQQQQQLLLHPQLQHHNYQQQPLTQKRMPTGQFGQALQALQSPDLLELCRPPTSSSLDHEVWLDSPTQQQPPSSRKADSNTSVSNRAAANEAPFCLYFE